MTNIEELSNQFNRTYQTPPELIVRAPGRVNLIGEHIDYNGGLVIPATIHPSIFLALSKRQDDIIYSHAHNLNEQIQLDVHQFSKNKLHWVNCIIGTWNQLKKANTIHHGVNISITSDLPVGSGLSSSSALCCGLIKGIAELHEIELTPLQIAEMAFAVEHEFIGIQCGFMDQFTICHGKANQAIVLNTQTNDFDYVTIPNKDCEWFLLNSKVERSLHNSAYNDRRASCERVVEAANEHLGYVEFLTDLSVDDLAELKPFVASADYQKAEFVIEEQQRSFQFYQAMTENNFVQMGVLLTQCQIGLEKKYEVSCWEIDTLIEACAQHPDIFGARMMGGGFGGCVLILAKPETDLNSVLTHYYESFEVLADVIKLKFERGLDIVLS